MKPNYIAKKSLWGAVTPVRIFLFFLIIPLIILIADMIRLSCHRIEFYDKKIVHKLGVFSKQEKVFYFTGVMSVYTHQSFIGRIFGYGDVKVDFQGRYDIGTDCIKRPNKLRDYLSHYIVTNQNNISFVERA